MKKGYRYYLVVNNFAIRLLYHVIVGLIRVGTHLHPNLTWNVHVRTVRD